MSALQHYKLTCDHRGCQAEIDLGLSRADHTRSIATTTHGWRHEVRPRSSGPCMSLDYCPEHARAS